MVDVVYRKRLVGVRLGGDGVVGGLVVAVPLLYDDTLHLLPVIHLDKKDGLDVTLRSTRRWHLKPQILVLVQAWKGFTVSSLNDQGRKKNAGQTSEED